MMIYLIKLKIFLHLFMILEHTAYHPIYSLDEKVVQSDFSYKDTYNLSLDKVGALISHLQSNKRLEYQYHNYW